jgi:hypothetical protein
MRRSTEFTQWVEDNMHKLEGKQVQGYDNCVDMLQFMRSTM